MAPTKLLHRSQSSSPKVERPCLVLIPLGGIGKRFSDAGHSVPKPLIEALGQPILYWLLKSLRIDDDKGNSTNAATNAATSTSTSTGTTTKGGGPSMMTVAKIIIPYHPDLARFRFADQLEKDFPNLPFHFVPLAGDTRGAADTLRIALESLNGANVPDDMPIVSLDGDNFYTTDVLGLWRGRDAVVTFPDYGSKPIYSYVKVDKQQQQSNNNNNSGDDDMRIYEIKEKEKISNLACTGAYGFSSWHRLLDYAKRTLSNPEYMQKNEYYISSVIALMLNQKDIPFSAVVVPKESYVCLGTPLQLRAFCNDFPKRNVQGRVVIPSRRYCFDLDNTLVTYPRVTGDYTTCEPIQYMIDYLHYLKKFDHVIIIYTARRMKTHKGNVGALVADIGRITFDTLAKFNIPYDEIHFGKPHADHYIDDLAVSAYHDVEKALGFYRSHVEPRAFNDISQPSSMALIRKKGKQDDIGSSNDNSHSGHSSLEGEIYFYNHIPLSVKDCFPIMVAYNQQGNWYDVEQIPGTTVSSLFLSHELTPSVFHSIMTTLHRIHKATDFHEDFDIDLYASYANKLRQRYDQYPAVYSKFAGADKVFARLMEELQAYEAEGCGQCGVIHGDPVFSNILVNSFGKIKLIDMRGKLGDTPTIRGDELYDWAKLYQSLIGYDEILTSRQTITEHYRQSLLSCFWTTLAEISPEISPTHVKLVTRSLLFSLLPLHSAESEAEKQQGYYGLIEKCGA